MKDIVNKDEPIVVSPQQRPKPTTSCRLRKDLMFKLGIQGAKTHGKTERREPSRGSLLGNVQLTSEPLKFEEERIGPEAKVSFWGIGELFKRMDSSTQVPDAEPSSFSSERSSSSVSSNSRRLSFNDEVAVCPIPKRDEYSKRIRSRLWQSAEEMMLNVHRNSIEFAAEGWDWRNTMEDDEMYRCLATNELIHPVHVEQDKVQLAKDERKQCG